MRDHYRRGRACPDVHSAARAGSRGSKGGSKVEEDGPVHVCGTVALTLGHYCVTNSVKFREGERFEGERFNVCPRSSPCCA